jgi:hypothetical protein
MSATDALLANNAAYVASFDKGDLPLPPARKDTDCGMLTFTDDELKRSIQDDVGIKREWAAEAFSDVDEDVRQSIARIEASPLTTGALRGIT